MGGPLGVNTAVIGEKSGVGRGHGPSHLHTAHLKRLPVKKLLLQPSHSTPRWRGSMDDGSLAMVRFSTPYRRALKDPLGGTVVACPSGTRECHRGSRQQRQAISCTATQEACSPPRELVKGAYCSKEYGVRGVSRMEWGDLTSKHQVVVGVL